VTDLRQQAMLHGKQFLPSDFLTESISFLSDQYQHFNHRVKYYVGKITSCYICMRESGGEMPHDEYICVK